MNSQIFQQRRTHKFDTKQMVEAATDAMSIRLIDDMDVLKLGNEVDAKCVNGDQRTTATSVASSFSSLPRSVSPFEDVSSLDAPVSPFDVKNHDETTMQMSLSHLAPRPKKAILKRAVSAGAVLESGVYKAKDDPLGVYPSFEQHVKFSPPPRPNNALPSFAHLKPAAAKTAALPAGTKGPPSFAHLKPPMASKTASRRAVTVSVVQDVHVRDVPSEFAPLKMARPSFRRAVSVGGRRLRRQTSEDSLDEIPFPKQL